ncbi:MAG: hypothetical protein EBR93_04300 [Bacteroidetes bacterium]|nr:hypothetical protein [Bacteroidota bacterium]
MEELIRDYKGEVRDPEQFEKLFANCLLDEIQSAIEWIIDAVESDLDVDLDYYASGGVIKGSAFKNYLKEYLQERSETIGVEDAWFRQSK